LSPELRVFDPFAPTATSGVVAAAQKELPALATLGLETLSLELKDEVLVAAPLRLPKAAVASRVPPALTTGIPSSGLREDEQAPEIQIPTDLYIRFLEAGRFARMRGQHQKTYQGGQAKIVRSES